MVTRAFVRDRKIIACSYTDSRPTFLTQERKGYLADVNGSRRCFRSPSEHQSRKKIHTHAKTVPINDIYVLDEALIPP